MNITFLIGNGFDLAVGLKTRYADFLEYYLSGSQRFKDAKKIKKFKAMIKGGSENWADVELAMGEITKKFDDKNYYEKCYTHLKDNLAKYLEREQAKVDYKSNNGEIIKCFRDSITEYYTHLRAPGDQQEFINQYATISGTQHFNFISFNYTNVFDKCLGLLTNPLSVNNINNRNILSKKGEIIHIHGTIDKNMIMGVNDVNQISNENFKEDEKFSRFYIKPQCNKVIGYQIDIKARNFINNSSIIVVFGMSLGITDKCWWELIGKWLLGDDKRKLVIVSKVEDFSKRHPQVSIKSEESIKELFLSQTNLTLTDAQKKNLEARIYVILNSDMFKIDITKNNSMPSIQTNIE